MQVPKANERKITQRKNNNKMLTRLVPLAFDYTRVSRRSEPRMLPWKQHGEYLYCVRLWDEFKSKSGNSTFTFRKKTTKHLNGMDKSCKNEPENFPVPTSYSVVCALYPTLNCFHDQFTADLRAETGYRRRQLNKDTVSTLMTEKCQTAQKLEEVVLL